ncbi:ABC transporter ATP-binding protein [Starkeya sp. ORNL1]|uniref:ABC transporter ATP-binding protein n=1 Tax=Starkeya sp. ORNL1 TaxID=2709380 RepID=UPI0014643B28|nr:ABC transporter ATP-binding protein [Starkeya sp. ORNL1]QJP14132.1 ABC transporter ATP-binding protein [Starkeya sp. ORNL1]
MVELVVQNLTKRFGLVTAVDNVSFHIADGEFLTLLGPSGCGKSTTLAAVAGLDVPDQGLIRAGDRVFFDSAKGQVLPAEARNCGLVFQSYALWPHMTVQQNLAFPLKLRKIRSKERSARIAEALALVEMADYADRYPHQLSGGQQQRVALARTLVYQPLVLLLDEPLSNLDAKLRERARTWLDHLHQKVRLTTLYVTHDQIEALALSDRIAVMNGGRIVQLGTPREIYEHPADPFVADFIGTSNFFSGAVVAADAARTALVRLDGGAEMRTVLPRDLAPGARVTVAIRPEKLELTTSPDHAPGEEGVVLPASVTTRSYIGGRWQYQLTVGGVVVKVESPADYDQAQLWLHVPTAGSVVFPASEARRDPVPSPGLAAA